MSAYEFQKMARARIVTNGGGAEQSSPIRYLERNITFRGVQDVSLSKCLCLLFEGGRIHTICQTPESLCRDSGVFRALCHRDCGIAATALTITRSCTR